MNIVFIHRQISISLLIAAMLGISLPLLAQSENSKANDLVAASNATPDAVVSGLEHTLLANMQDDQLNHDGRSQRLQVVVNRAFDFPRMGRFLFGSRWKNFDQTEKDRFSDAFGALTVATYATRFKQFNNEQFVPISSEQPGSNRAQVRHELVTGKGERIAFDYLLLQQNNEWRIVNITTRGVSDLSLKRSQYSKLYNQGGLDAVVEYIQQQSKRLSSE